MTRGTRAAAPRRAAAVKRQRDDYESDDEVASPSQGSSSTQSGGTFGASPEKYRKYRAKQKKHLADLEQALEDSHAEVMRYKEREQKLLYLLILATKQASAKELELTRLRAAPNVDDRRLGVLSMVATSSAPPAEPPVVPEQVKNPQMPSMPLTSSFLLPGTSGSLQPAALLRDNSLPSAALSHRPSFISLASLPTFADDILERAFPDNAIDDFRDTVLDAIIADQLYSRLTRNDSGVPAPSAAAEGDASASTKEDKGKGPRGRASRNSSTTVPASPPAGDVGRAGAFADYFKAIANK